MKPKRSIRIEGDVAYIPLTKGYEAIIDSMNVDSVKDRDWHAIVRSNTVYAAAVFRLPNGGRSIVYLHRLIALTPEKLYTDHINGNGLDNRISNLRHVTTSENVQNTKIRKNNKSGFKGVSFHKKSSKWIASIGRQGERWHLGCYETAELASEAYKNAAIDIHGEFARI